MDDLGVQNAEKTGIESEIIANKREGLMTKLKDKLASRIPQLRDNYQRVLKQYGDREISKVTVQQLFGGMRGVRTLFCDTSVVDPEKGLIIRGYPILEIAHRLPEEIFLLLLLGEMPTPEETSDFQRTLSDHEPLPAYIWQAMRSLPRDTHPMVRLSMGILSMERESRFRQRYEAGMKKSDYWEPALDDAIRILSILPELAAGIYRIYTGEGDPIPPRKDLDWGANYAYMLGFEDKNGEFARLMRRYLVLHSDHEGGNVSAFTNHVVSSALSDPYLAVSAGLNGLAGPLHGLANQECLAFVIEIMERYHGVPSDEQLREFAWERLNSGQVIPGFGHAVLRVTDPRFTAMHQFGLECCPDSPPFKIVDRLFAVVPEVLVKQGKAKNPYPNVDAVSGSLLYHYGLRENNYYTVLFGVARAMGMLSQLVLNRALGAPIFRPKSVRLDWVRQLLEAK